MVPSPVRQRHFVIFDGAGEWARQRVQRRREWLCPDGRLGRRPVELKGAASLLSDYPGLVAKPGSYPCVIVHPNGERLAADLDLSAGRSPRVRYSTGRAKSATASERCRSPRSDTRCSRAGGLQHASGQLG